jgi:GDP-L-fucose synthase
MQPGARIYVAGHSGLVGSALRRELTAQGYEHVLGRRRSELDLTQPGDVDEFFRQQRPEFVFLAAGRVGGIRAIAQAPADFLGDNLAIQQNVLTAARRHGVTKLLNIGCSCVYPQTVAQPICEEALLSGPLEPNVSAYALAKIAGLRLTQAMRRQQGSDFIACVSTNLYGPEDNFDPAASHVLPAMIRRFHDAHRAGIPSVTCWGSGTARREFLFSDDLARAAVFLMRQYSEEPFLNVGFGSDVSIRELAETVARVVGYAGEILWDTSKPDGTAQRLLDSSRIRALGWQPGVPLEDGIRRAYEGFLRSNAN